MITMKLIICAVLIAIVEATPLYRSDENGEEKIVNRPDWRLIPDGDYKLHLVDINAADMEAEPFFNGINDMIFRLFTRSNPITPQVIQINNAAQLQASFFNATHQSRFHIHGWTQGGPDTANGYRDVYLARGEFNVFAVDWGAGAQTPNYILARNRVGETGRTVAQFIDFLNLHGHPFSAITVIGHSLGAHCAGHTGKAVTRGRLPVIVALDPAGPLFTIDNPSDRVDHTDATHVEVLATDIVFLGFEQPIGHANFYPNWGTEQPSCEGEIGGLCSHIIAAQFMQESINPANVFGAIRCRDFNDIRDRNCVVSGPSRRMGGEPVVDGTSPPGSVYFLTTNPSSPFSQGPR